MSARLCQSLHSPACGVTAAEESLAKDRIGSLLDGIVVTSCTLRLVVGFVNDLGVGGRSGQGLPNGNSLVLKTGGCRPGLIRDLNGVEACKVETVQVDRETVGSRSVGLEERSYKHPIIRHDHGEAGVGTCLEAEELRAARVDLHNCLGSVIPEVIVRHLIEAVLELELRDHKETLL